MFGVFSGLHGVLEAEANFHIMIVVFQLLSGNTLCPILRKRPSFLLYTYSVTFLLVVVLVLLLLLLHSLLLSLSSCSSGSGTEMGNFRVMP